MDRFDLLQPSTVDEALALLATHAGDAQVIGGGAMLTVLLRERLVAPRYVISVGDIPALAAQRFVHADLEMGAACTLRAIERDPAVRQSWPILAEATHLVGNVRVRNVATIGGHLAQADPHMDLPPVLSALGARVTIRSSTNQRTLPVDELLTGYYETSLAPDELILSILVPRPPEGLHGAYLKYCALSPNDWPTVGVAAFVRLAENRLEEVRLVAGCVADRPLRLPDVEAHLIGESPSAALFSEAGRRYAAAAEPLADIRGSAEYKRQVTAVIVRRALEAACERARGNRK